MAKLDAATQEKLTLAAAVGSDADLDARDRRTRPAILPRLTVVVGDVVLVDDLEITVLGPGRGQGAFTGGWKDPEGENIGTFFERQVTRVNNVPVKVDAVPEAKP